MRTSEVGTERGAEVVELRLAARPENVALARLALTGVAVAAGAPPAVVADLKLAVSEACTNAVQHAYAKPRVDGEQQVTLRFLVSKRKVVVEVEDQGIGFRVVAGSNWAGGSVADGALDEPGLGLGLTIVRSVTDELEIESGDRGSRVVFSKRF